MQGKRSPAVLILSAPSGAGKTSLARELTARRPDAALAVSHTTRAQRNGEKDGIDYHFIAPAQFAEMVAARCFIEHASVFGNQYGTSLGAVEALFARGKHAILEIDWQGARAVRRRFPHAQSVFVMPPSVEALEQRLKSRRQDADDVIAARMRAARDEIRHSNEYDHIIVNDRFEHALSLLEAVLPPPARNR
ncbi:MAG: guanylate kinase [Gammaproteobacteria bacterium]